ncbi:MAG: hypothetical protein QM820_52035 [Minicystis sp.]
MDRHALITGLALAAITLAACSGSLPLPKTGPHLGDDPMSVPSQPPPGKVEIIGAPPANLKNAVWLDGEWIWTGRRWQWKEGRWEEPQGDYWAPSITVRMADGSLAHFKGVWKKGAAPR